MLLPQSWCEKDGQGMKIMGDEEFENLKRTMQVLNLPRKSERLEVRLPQICFAWNRLLVLAWACAPGFNTICQSRTTQSHKNTDRIKHGQHSQTMHASNCWC